MPVLSVHIQAFAMRWRMPFSPLPAKTMNPATFPARHALLAVAGAFAFMCMPAVAQEQATDMPPRLQQIDELPGSAPSSTATEASPTKPGARQIIEKRERGHVTSIEVRSGESSYYIDPGEQPGTVIPGDAQSSTTRAPQWKIFEFDLKRPVESANSAAQPAPAAPPAPVK